MAPKCKLTAKVIYISKQTSKVNIKEYKVNIFKMI